MKNVTPGDIKALKVTQGDLEFEIDFRNVQKINRNKGSRYDVEYVTRWWTDEYEAPSTLKNVRIEYVLADSYKPLTVEDFRKRLCALSEVPVMYLSAKGFQRANDELDAEDAGNQS